MDIFLAALSGICFYEYVKCFKRLYPIYETYMQKSNKCFSDLVSQKETPYSIRFVHFLYRAPIHRKHPEKCLKTGF